MNGLNESTVITARILILAWENDCNPISYYYVYPPKPLLFLKLETSFQLSATVGTGLLNGLIKHKGPDV